jgi:hypothetical protein
MVLEAKKVLYNGGIAMAAVHTLASVGDMCTSCFAQNEAVGRYAASRARSEVHRSQLSVRVRYIPNECFYEDEQPRGRHITTRYVRGIEAPAGATSM